MGLQCQCQRLKFQSSVMFFRMDYCIMQNIQIEVHEIQFTKKEAGYKLIVTISGNFEKENLQTILSTIESWIDFILQSKEQKDISVFYDEDRY